VERAFEERVRCVVAQYGAYQVADGIHINGLLTAGENIADMGGLRTAYDAYRAGPAASTSAVGRDGFSSAQRFFVAYAQSWCTKRRPEYARMLAAIDPHSPPEFRVNGAISNLPDFGDAFTCHAGAPMAPRQRCEIW
jgi:predicted metalloendopeptidase